MAALGRIFEVQKEFRKAFGRENFRYVVALWASGYRDLKSQM